MERDGTHWAGVEKDEGVGFGGSPVEGTSYLPIRERLAIQRKHVLTTEQLGHRQICRSQMREKLHAD